MNRLNGWQRIWVVLAVVWAVPVFFIGHNAPSSVYHHTEYSEKPPYAKMSAAVRDRMSVKSWEGEECDGPTTTPPYGHLLEAVKDLPGLSHPVRLCFALKGIPEEAQKEIDAVTARMTAAQESEASIKLVVDEMKKRAWDKLDSIETKLPVEEIERLKTDYARAYGDELRHLRREHYGMAALVWTIPVITLYALGWSVGWIRRGFTK